MQAAEARGQVEATEKEPNGSHGSEQRMKPFGVSNVFVFITKAAKLRNLRFSFTSDTSCKTSTPPVQNLAQHQAEASEVEVAEASVPHSIGVKRG